jgi:hypothetical protein
MVRTLPALTIPALTTTSQLGPLKITVNKARPHSRKHAAALRVMGGICGLNWISAVV